MNSVSDHTASRPIGKEQIKGPDGIGNPSRRHDYIIIGGGHNGLVAANYLSKAGATVIVVEQRPYLGGLASSQPHVIAAPHHRLSQGAIDVVFLNATPIIVELGLTRHGLSFTDMECGYGWIDADGETLCIFKDVARTANDIARFSRSDSRRYVSLQNAFRALIRMQMPLFSKAAGKIGALDLIRAATRLVGDRDTRRALVQLASCSAYEAIATNFESDSLRSLYSYWCEIAGPADVDCSGLNLASLALIHQIGCARPVGSMGGLIDALERCLRSRGGSVLLDATVSEITVADNRADGVRLADGRTIRAGLGVLASCAPQMTYGRLLAPEHQKANSRTRLPFLPASSNNMCPFKVDMAVGGRVRFDRAQRKRDAMDGCDIGAVSLMTGSFEDHLEHAAALRAGRMGRTPPIWMTVLSHADRSIAPEGQEVVYLHTSAPFLPQGGWDTQSAPVAEDLIGAASRHLEGLGAEIGRCVTTPADFESQYSTPRGCLYHIDMLPTRMMKNRPASGMGNVETEVTRLYLAGSGSHPGGGVFGMPGFLAAQAALSSA